MTNSKVLLFLALLACTGQVLANHVLGGEITWECAGNNNFKVVFKVYRECGGNNTLLPGTLPLNSNIAGYNTINVSRDSVIELSPNCFNGTGISCQSSGQGIGAIELHRFESAPIPIPPQIPPSGYFFYWNLCCRSVNVQNVPNPAGKQYYFESIMYDLPSGDCNSPQFLSHDVYLNSSGDISFLASKPSPTDSLFYDFYIPFTATNATLNYKSGFSQSQPIPNSQTASTNGAVAIDHSVGHMSYNIANATSGLYTIGVEVECWRSNQLIAKVRRDVNLVYVQNSSTNSPPSAFIDTSGALVNYDGSRYKAEIEAGDTLNLSINAIDVDFNQDTSGSQVSQVISFLATGAALDTSWGGGFYDSLSQPIIQPKGTQTGFSNTISNQIEFSWPTSSQHAVGNEVRYFFNFQFHDDACDYNAKANLPLEVVVRNYTSIDKDSIVLCENDSVQLAGSTLSSAYLWQPSLEISDTSVANPWVYPTTSRYYYLEDPNNPGFKDSIFVDLEMRKTFDLDSVNSMLEVTDSVQTGNRVWYYNGVPFMYPYDTLSPFGPGDYSVVLNTQNCRYESDTIRFLPGSYSIADPNQGNLAPNVLSLSDSWGVQFELTNSAAGNLTTIYLPGIDTSGETTADDLQFQLYDSNGNLMWSKDTVVTGFSQGVFQVGLMQNLQANEQYTLAVTGDTGYAFHYFKDLPNLPVSPWNNGLSVTGLFEGAANTLPAQPHNKLLPLVLEVESTIGLEAYSESKIRIYPNPAQDRIYIEGVEKGSHIQLLDIQGKKLREFEVASERESIERGGLPSGIYFILMPSGLTEIIVFK